MRADGSGFGLAQALAFVLFAACLAWMLRGLAVTFKGDPILPSLLAQGQVGWVLAWQLTAFFIAAWFVHALFGIIAFALARLTELAFPWGLAAVRSWVITSWFIALAMLAGAANATWYPSSLFFPRALDWNEPVLGPLLPVELGMLVLAIVAALLSVAAGSRLRPVARAAVVPALFSGAVLAALLLPRAWLESGEDVSRDRPHIVVIGLDSMRSDLSLPRRGPAAAPEIRRFLREARQFSDATTPLARTYGSWMSILTGRHPVSTNARVNLMPRRLVREGDTLPQALRAAGYQTIYATDETRFANLDESFGFDQMIVPPPGAADFILGRVGDLPLVNLATATPFARWLFPSNHANRAAEVTYRPQQFLSRLAREASFGEPTCLMVHLTLAHWPYAWAGHRVPSNPDAYRAAYAAAIAEVDRQFGSLMRLLERRGVLENAYVVLLSDHGEALGDQSDSMLRATGTSREIWDSLWGHGTSVMSPHQFQVLLAMRALGRARLPGPAQNYDWPVSLEDLRPTLEELVTGHPPSGVDGLSLLPHMTDPVRAEAFAHRVRFTETDFNTPSILAGRYEQSQLFDEAVAFYEIEPESGWVQFRPERLQELLAQKQRAAFTSDSLLAVIPGPPESPARYLFTSRQNPYPRDLNAPPGAWIEPEARRLWDALERRYPGELPTTAALP